MVIDISAVAYPHFSGIMNLWPDPHRLLGEVIVWQAKEDGISVGIYLDADDNVRIRSRRSDDAIPEFYAIFKSCNEADSIEAMLRDARTWNTEYVVFAELCRRGASPARSTVHEDDHLVVFDIWSQKQGWYMPYTIVHQQCYHFDLPMVDCYGITRSIELADLLAIKEEMLARAKEDKKEGVVGKVWNPVNKVGDGDEHNRWIIFKEKLDSPKLERLRRITDGAPILPPLEDSEVYSAIEDVRMDLGVEFSNIKVAMPAIAAAIRDEQKKHFRSSPERKLVAYYRDALMRGVELAP